MPISPAPRRRSPDPNRADASRHFPAIGKSRRRVVLYVGAPKTGTTSVQAFLRVNQERLEAQGFYIPRAGRGGIGQHIDLPTIVNSQGRRNGLDRHANLNASDSGERRARFLADLNAELAAVADWHTLLFFSEYMFSSLPREVRAYREIFAPYAGGFESMMYLRRQDQWLASLTLQARKTGARSDLKLNPGSPERFAEGVRAWSTGSDICHVRRLDSAFLHGGHLLDDFCHVMGIDSVDMDMTEVRANPSALQEQIEILDVLNPKISLHRFQNQIHYRTRLVNLMSDLIGGARVEFRKDAAIKAFGSYEKINRWLCATRDPPGPEFFFNADFAGYVEEANNDRRYSREQLEAMLAEISRMRLEMGLSSVTLPVPATRSENIDFVVTAFVELRHEELAMRREQRLATRDAVGRPLPERSAPGSAREPAFQPSAVSPGSTPPSGAARRAGTPRRRRFARVLLFIGAPDAQTATLQATLRKSRAKLIQHGVYIPRAARAGVGQHIEIPAMFLVGEPREDLLRHIDVASEPAELRRRRVQAELDAEVSNAAACHTLLLFSEHMFYSDPGEVANYKDFFTGYSRTLECLTYLRRQDQWLLGLRLQARKANPHLAADWNPMPPDRYFAHLDAWATTCSRMQARRHEPEFMKPEGLLADLGDAIGIDPGSLVPPREAFKPQPRLQQFELLDALNEKLASLPAWRRVTYREGFAPLLTELVGGDEIHLANSEARALVTTYDAPNRWLAREFDPNGPPRFFLEDFPDQSPTRRGDPRYTLAELGLVSRALAARLRALEQPAREAAEGREQCVDVIVNNFIAVRRAEVNLSVPTPVG